MFAFLKMHIVVTCTYIFNRWLPGGAVVENLSASAGNARDRCLFPESGRSPGVGNSNPLH